MLKPSDLHSLAPLGQGPGTRVWKGLDAENQTLLLKTFSLAEAPNWKAEELFAREAQVLQQLDHPRLPRLLAYGVEDQTSYLIYPFIAGESLQAKLEGGWRPEQTQVFDLIRQLLETLIWLHDRQPPLVHRDIKPSNLVLTAEQQLYLIDFGSVLQHLKPHGGSTVAGTFGYMAPEQLSGRALPASDLYGVGACLIHLLSGKAPAELPQERLWIRFEDHVQLSGPLKRWLKTLIDPVLEERCQNARQALSSLEKALKAPLTPEIVAAPPTEISLVKNWPVPVPETGMSAIDVQKVPQGISVLLPRRESKQSGNEFLRSNLGLLAVAFVLFKSYQSLVSPLQMSNYIFWALGIMGAYGGASYYRFQQLSGRQTHLTLTNSKLIVHFSDKAKSYHIPWSRITSLKQRRRGRGLQINYRDPKTGNHRRLRLGRSVEPHEQYWLFGILDETLSQNKLLTGDLPQNPSD